MQRLTAEQIENFKKFIDSHDFFYIIGHKEPDGDCVSSCLGLADILKKSNKSFKLLNAGPFKRVEIKNYADFFSSEMDFMSSQDIKKTGLFVCDCSELHRLGEIENAVFEELDTFIIDHHKTSECPENTNSIIDSSAPAASLIVQQLYENFIGLIPKETAEKLFFGIMTDTGFFRFLTEKDADSIEQISKLVAAGANPRKTYDLMTSGKAFSTRKLLGIMLDRAKQYIDGKVIVTYETMEDTKKWGQEGRDSDLLYSSLLAVEGAEAVVFVRQETETTCTAGFRSKDKIDVSAIAAKFGGGGHKNASGLSTNGRLETLIPAIVKEFARVI